jgi:hypothetical protein
VLLSAVPLYLAIPRRERRRKGGAGHPPAFEARRIYFSDGGITSNCPVHLFDAPLPAYPTFGVNLYRLPAGTPPRVSRSDTADPELDDVSTPDAGKWKTPLPFILRILRTSRDWRDGLQRRLPGYRERIVHVGLSPESGGLNLAMTPRTIRRLGRVGAVAARRLERDFSTPRRVGEPNAWERHRWTRARSTLTALHRYLKAFESVLLPGPDMRELQGDDPDTRRLLQVEQPARDPWSGRVARQQGAGLADGAAALLRAVDSARPSTAMDELAPEPRPDLRISPPW